MNATIGFIGGGQMAEALIKGLISANLYSPDTIYLIEPDENRCSYMKDTYTVQSVQDELFWKNCQTVVLAVKPQVMTSVLNGAKTYISSKHLLITIAAGLPIRLYEETLQGDTNKIIRVMPNTPALILKGASAISGNKNTTEKDLQLAESIFSAVGVSILIDEQYLDAVTGLSGSGPAYVFTFIEALIDAGVKVGLPRQTAETLAVQTVIGSAKLIQSEQKHPASLRAMVTSPGGTTIAGLHELEKKSFRGILMDAVEAATNRSIELGKQ